MKGRELIKSIDYNGVGHFIITSVNLHPLSFPRLNSYSSIYEMYIFHQARAIFQSSMPTTQSGLAALAVEYDVTDSAPTDMSGMMRNISSSMSNVYADNSCLVDKRLSRLAKYLTNTGTTLQNYQARIHAATEGVHGVDDDLYSAGYLLIEYDVEFFTPQ